MGGGSGRIDAGASLPPGWRTGTKNLGKSIKGFIRDPRFGGTLDSALDWFTQLPGQGNRAFDTAQEAFTSQAEDPTRLTNPLFRQQREQLGGELVERSRQMGLTSGDAATTVSEGLSDFTNRYLSSSFEGQRAAAMGLTGLPGARAQFGQALFTPFQAATAPITAIAGRSGGQQPGYDNSKSQTWSTVGQIVGQSSMAYASAGSDSRLKDSIRTILYIGPLRLVSWLWNTNAVIINKTPGAYETGFLAEEVAPIYPECVTRDSAGYLRLNYSRLIHHICSEDLI